MNNKKQFFSKLFILGLGIGIVLGVNYIYAGVHTNPTQSFPNGNIDAPINTGTQTQTKDGPLVLTDSSGQYYYGPLLSVEGRADVDDGIITSNVISTGISQFQNILLTDLVSTGQGEKSVCSDDTGKIISCTSNEGILTPFRSAQDYYKSYNIGDVYGDTTNAIASDNSFPSQIFYKKTGDMVFLDIQLKFKINFENTATFYAYFPANLPKPLKGSRFIPVVIGDQSLLVNLGGKSKANYMGNVSIEEKWGAVIVTLEPVGLEYFKDDMFDKSKGFNHYLPISFQYFY